MRKLSPALLALAWKRTRGTWALLGVSALTLVTAGSLAALGVHLAKSHAVEANDALASLPMLDARAVLWGPGFMAVVVSTLHAWRRDENEGILQLSRAGGHDVRSYLQARVLVLGAWVFGSWLASMLLLSLVVYGASPAAPGLLAGVLPASAFALAASTVLALLGGVCLGPRTRPGGYLLLAAILFVPEALAPWTRPWLGRDLASIPALLGGLGKALAPFDALRFGKCLAATAALVVLLRAWLRRAASAWAEAAR